MSAPSAPPDPNVARFLEVHDACADGRRWASAQPGLDDLWRRCAVTEWMLWALERVGFRDDASLRRFACACAQRRLELVPSARIRHVVVCAEAVAKGDARPAELVAAAEAARLRAEQAAGEPGWNAAQAAAQASVLACARLDVYRAAIEAAKHAARSVAWDVRTGSTPEQEQQWQTQMLRRLVEPRVPEILELARASVRA